MSSLFWGIEMKRKIISAIMAFVMVISIVHLDTIKVNAITNGGPSSSPTPTPTPTPAATATSSPSIIRLELDLKEKMRH